MLLAFADDLITISRAKQDVKLVLANPIEFLSYVEVNLHEDKWKVLIRQPSLVQLTSKTQVGGGAGYK